MANIPAFVPVRGEVILPITAEAKGRVGQGYSVLDGLSGAEQGTPDMTIAIAAGTVRENYVLKPVSAGNVTHDAHHDTLGRKDIIYIDANGAIAVWKGDDLAVVDPQGNGNWKEYTSPYPKAACPAGVPLYEVYIAPGAEHIHTTDLRSIAQYDPRGTAQNALSFLAHLPGHYERSRMWCNKGSSSAAYRRTLVSPDLFTVNINNIGYAKLAAVELDLNAAGSWDTTAGTDYTSAANRAGKDFYAYACQPLSGNTPVILVSAAATYPDGYDADTSRKIGGFHCLGVAVNHGGAGHTLTHWEADHAMALGETVIAVAPETPCFLYRAVAIAGDFKTHAATEPNWASIAVGATIVDDQVTWVKESHALEGYLAGDILPRSVWDLKHRSAGLQAGMVWAGKTDFDSAFYGASIWVAIYLASGTGASTTSVNGGTISDTRNWMDFVDDFAAIGCRMLEDDEFQAIARGSNEETNITGSADPATTGGHVDTAGRRMISHIGCEGCCGELWQWLRTQSYRSDGADEAAHQAWAWENLPGAKGSMYKQGTYGDVKLLAGGAWADGSTCGSRCRTAYRYRWYTISTIGGRFAAEPQ